MSIDRDEALPYLLEPPTEPDQVLPEREGAQSFGFGHPDVDPLCAYLDWDNGLFERFEDRYFNELSVLLQLNGSLKVGVSVGRDTFRDAVRDFQRARGLSTDGLPGADTLWALHAPILARPLLGTATVKADKVDGSGGYTSFTVRTDVAGSYNGFYAELAAAGARVSSAGALRPLNAEVSPGRSATSLHYSGLALDLATDTGMNWGARKAWKYLVEKDNGRWRVYVDAPSAPKRAVNAVIWENGTTRSQIIEGNYLDLTAAAVRYGFAVIGPRSSFPGNYLSSEWWHLQFTGGLVPGISLFGVELLKTHTEKALEPTPPWQWRKNVYYRQTSGKGWF